MVGVGALGRHHLRALAGLPGARLTGAYDLIAERSAQALEHHAAAFASLDALLESCAAVVIATPTATHREIAGKALEAGRHCLVEKPLARSVAECRELIELAGRRQLVLHTGHVERMNPAVRAARPLIRKPRFIEAHRLASFGPRGVDVDVLLDLMIHDLDLVLDWTGAEPESVDGVGVAVLTEREDIANARLLFEDGCVADLTASRVSQERMRKIRLFQADAYLSLDCARGTAEIVEADRVALAAAAAGAVPAIAAASHRPSGEAPDWSALVTRRSLPRPEGDPIALENEAFLAAIAGHPAPSGVVAADGRAGERAVRVAEKVSQALRERAARWRS